MKGYKENMAFLVIVYLCFSYTFKLLSVMRFHIIFPRVRQEEQANYVALHDPSQGSQFKLIIDRALQSQAFTEAFDKTGGQ